MKTITFTCETITPMFLSGADGSTPELRPPSIKGALRFWWRAMKAGEFENPTKMKEAENEIFGGVEPKAMRSKVLITCPKDKNFLKKSIKSKFPEYKENYPLSRNTPVNILNYLSYGVYDYRKGFTHAFFDEKQKFDVCLKVLDNAKMPEIINAFVLMCYVGGLGSKSRNGFGKIKIISAIENESIDITGNLPKWKDLLVSSQSKSSFTSLSNSNLLFTTKEVNKGAYDKTLSIIGDAYIYARKNMKDGHNYDIRRYIASPINQDKNAFLERHSKSYFLFLDEENEGYRGYILFLPYQYVESIDKDNLKKGKVVPEGVIEKFDDATQKFNQKIQEKLTEITL